MPELLKHIPIFGTQVACADYETGFAAIARLAKRDRPSAVCASNTHIVSHARYDRSFGDVMRSFDLILPDGMPLIWYLNRHGAKLSDRVYGPYFMRYALQHSTPELKHFFFGGKRSTLDSLLKQAKALNPLVNIVGSYSPPYRKWNEEDESENARLIQEADPDFIWVALGGERQERWIAANLRRHQRGVFLAVGDAFELLAGNRSFAPKWIQRWGLTWLYRLSQEPRRLWGRYFKYNSLFLYYLALEVFGLDKKNSGFGIQDSEKVTKSFGIGRKNLVLQENKDSAFRSQPSALGFKIAFIGSRGVPARYSGFETVVEELGRCLVQRGHLVTVYNRTFYYPTRFEQSHGMQIKWFPTVRSKSLETTVHTIFCLIDALFQRYDIIYLCGVGNAPLSRFLLWLSKTKLIINVDGADYRRAKWGPIGRFWLCRSEREAVKVADAVIADNPEIVTRYKKSYGYQPEMISYGSPVGCSYESTGVLGKFNLSSRGYFLYVGRLTPENEALLAIEGYLRFLRKIEDQKAETGDLRPDADTLQDRDWPEARAEAESGIPKLVIVGDAGYESAYYAKLRQKAAPHPEQIIFTGTQFGDCYRELSDHSLAFLLPAQIEATRLVLLDQMGFGAAIIYYDCEATRHVIGDAGFQFGDNAKAQDQYELLGDAENLHLRSSADSLAEQLCFTHQNPASVESMRKRAYERAKRHFSWDAVTDRYEEIFRELKPDA